MPRHVVFLRAINVGGRVVKMRDLAIYFGRMGFVEVETFIASGNIIVKSSLRTASAVEWRVGQGLPDQLGFQAEAFARSDVELYRISKRAQALQAALGGVGEANVCFLREPLSPEQRRLLKSFDNPLDSFVLEGTQLYWLCGGRQSDSKFSNVALEKKLQLRSTLRRANMLQRLCLQLRGKQS